MIRLHELFRYAVGLAPQSIASGNKTGSYIRAGLDNLFHITAGAIPDGKTVVAQLYEAKDGKGTDAQEITGATCTITATDYVTKANILVSSPTADKKTIVNGITYTAKAATSVPDKQFADATGLAACINYWQADSLYAEVSSTNVLISGKNPGETKITIGGDTEATKLVPSCLEAQAYIDIDAGKMDIADKYTHLAIKLTTDDTIVVGANVTINDYQRSIPAIQCDAAHKVVV